ncbi:MAG: diaminopimelate epimerase, partial [Thermodesulfobacteriota bacterium]
LGVGFDQALVLKKSRKADFKMEIYNSDGSKVEMCGNGIRCLAKYIWDRKLSKKDVLTIETLAGTIKPERRGKLIRVDMGEPVFDPREIPVKAPKNSSVPLIDLPLKVGGRRFLITCVSMGNPHAVIFVSKIDKFDLEKFGPLIENNRIFPERVNVGIAEVVSKKRIKLRVWERGAGATLACGTGASAAAVAARLKGLTSPTATFTLPGGDLKIEVAKDGHVYMTGPAEEVFTGTAKI